MPNTGLLLSLVLGTLLQGRARGHAGHVHVFDGACTASIQAVAAYDDVLYFSDWGSRQLFEVERGTWEVARSWDVPLAPGAPESVGGQDETVYQYFEVFASPTSSQPRRLSVLEQYQVAHLDTATAGDATTFGPYASTGESCGLRAKARTRAGENGTLTTLLLDVTSGAIRTWNPDTAQCEDLVTATEVASMRSQTQGLTLGEGDQSDFHFWGFEYVSGTYFHLTRNLGDGRVTVWRDGSVDLGLDLLHRDLPETQMVIHGYGDLFWHAESGHMYVTNGEGDRDSFFSPNPQLRDHPNGKIWAFEAFLAPDAISPILYAAGLRQPWHSVLDYDRQSIIVADVGENYYEKMVRVPLPESKAQLLSLPTPAYNLLWPVYEGFGRYTLGVKLLTSTGTKLLLPTVEWKHCLQEWLFPVMVSFWFVLLVLFSVSVWYLLPLFGVDTVSLGEFFRPQPSSHTLLTLALLSLIVVACIPFPVEIRLTALREAGSSDTQTIKTRFGVVYGFDTVEDLRQELWIPYPDLRKALVPTSLWYYAWGFSVLTALTLATYRLMDDYAKSRYVYGMTWVASLFLLVSFSFFFAMRSTMADAGDWNLLQGTLLLAPLTLLLTSLWIQHRTPLPYKKISARSRQGQWRFA
jgi:hypothetical protein